MRVRKIGYTTYKRSETFWLEQQAKGIEIQVTRGGKTLMTLFGVPFEILESSEQKLRRNKLLIRATPRPTAQER
jgi:hypothetical protein